MQSNRQTETQEPTSERITLTGLDCLFEETIADEPDAGLTIAQAVHYYGLPAKVIKAKVKAGEIPGIKMARKKWRVYPMGLPDAFPQPAEEGILTIPFDIQESPLTLQLKSKVAELEAKLEAAAFRNGYLEAKLEWTEGQVRLLSHQPKEKTLWQKLVSTFKWT
jgi:hypothetical protein